MQHRQSCARDLIGEQPTPPQVPRGQVDTVRKRVISTSHPSPKISSTNQTA